MANNLYPRFKRACLAKEVDLDTDAIHAALIDGADYVYAATHSSYATDVGSLAKVADVALTGLDITTTDGTFDSADFTWTSVTGDQSEEIILWDNDTTTPIADQLIANYDTGMTGMPVTPNGGDINVTVHTSGWFAL